MKKPSQISSASFRCPVCGSTLFKRSTEQLHTLLFQAWLQCRNPQCKVFCRGFEEITHRLSPPVAPRAGLDLPYIKGPALFELSQRLVKTRHGRISA